MGIATSGSVLGTLIGMFFLALLHAVLGDLALKFGAYEFFWLALFGVIIAGTLTGSDPLKGWIAGMLGILCATVGQEAHLRVRPVHVRRIAISPAASSWFPRWSARSASRSCWSPFARKRFR